MTKFKVKVKETNKESGLQKNDEYWVYDVDWYKPAVTSLDGVPPRDILYFLIFNRKHNRFIYEHSQNFIEVPDKILTTLK